MSLESAFNSYHEQIAREKVKKETWGHLLPKKDASFNGSITFAVSEYTAIGVVPIRVSFGDKTEHSPWFYGDMLNFLQEQKLIAGKVYQFNGNCLFTDDGFKFKGSITPLF